MSAHGLYIAEIKNDEDSSPCDTYVLFSGAEYKFVSLYGHLPYNVSVEIDIRTIEK